MMMMMMMISIIIFLACHYVMYEMLHSMRPHTLTVFFFRILHTICSVLNIIKCPALFTESILTPARLLL